MASQEALYTYWLGFAGGNDLPATPTSPDVVALAFGVTDWFSTIGLDYLTNFPLVIAALRAQLGPEALITLPVYMGIERDAYLGSVKDFITAVNTMAYWLDYDGQIALYEQYASVVGPAKVGIGVSNPGSGDNSTPLGAVSKLAQYVPSGGSKYGMMFWNLNSPSDPSQAAQWCQLISSNLSTCRRRPSPAWRDPGAP